ncbi:hypothetical protein D3C86_1976770 [compost metagenome]
MNFSEDIHEIGRECSRMVEKYEIKNEFETKAYRFICGGLAVYGDFGSYRSGKNEEYEAGYHGHCSTLDDGHAVDSGV